MNTATIPSWTAQDRIPPRSDSSPLGTIDLLLRNRQKYLELINDEQQRREVARTMLLTIALGAMVFGASVGAYRGGLQILIGAIKIPTVELLTAVVTAPALSLLSIAVYGKTDLRRDFVLLLSAFGLATLAMAALAPLMLLARCYSFEYHDATLLLVACCAVGGLLGTSLLLSGLRGETRGGQFIVAVATLGLMAVVGAQASWSCRPFLGRPSQENIPVLRGVEGNFFDSVGTSIDSARGVYR